MIKKLILVLLLFPVLCTAQTITPNWSVFGAGSHSFSVGFTGQTGGRKTLIDSVNLYLRFLQKLDSTGNGGYATNWKLKKYVPWSYIHTNSTTAIFGDSVGYNAILTLDPVGRIANIESNTDLSNSHLYLQDNGAYLSYTDAEQTQAINLTGFGNSIIISNGYGNGAAYDVEPTFTNRLQIPDVGYVDDAISGLTGSYVALNPTTSQTVTQGNKDFFIHGENSNYVYDLAAYFSGGVPSFQIGANSLTDDRHGSLNITPNTTELRYEDALSRQFIINESAGIIANTIDSTGIKYNGTDDFSNPQPLTLMPKSYIDNAISAIPIYNFYNGITNTAGNVGLGGNLTGFTFVNTNGQVLLMGSSGGLTLVAPSQTSLGSLLHGFQSNIISGGADLSSTPKIVLKRVSTSTNNESSFSIDSAGIHLRDDSLMHGILYSHIDFSNLIDSSLVPKKWVIDRIDAAISGGTSPTGSAGGDLSGTYPNPTVNTINGITKSFYDATSSIQTQLNGKQASLGFTAENVANKTATASSSTTTYPNWLGVENYVTSLGYGTGTVNNVVLNTPSIFTNPVTYTTTSGTATGTLSLVTQSQNRFFAGPVSGSPANPIFRAIDATDLPNIGANPTATAGSTAVNGSATTYMRSDAAPKVDSAVFATNAKLSTYQSKAALNAIPLGLRVFGNSLSNGVGATPAINTGTTASPLNGYAFVLSKSVGGPLYNYSRNGDQAADLGFKWLFQTTNPQGGNTDMPTIEEIGTNDITQYNSSTNLQNVFNRLTLANLSWSAIPQASKRFGQAFTLTGFTADNTTQTGLGITSVTNGNTASGTITTNASSFIYLWYLIKDGNTGTFTAKIDGTLQSDPYTASTTINAFGDGSAAINTQNGTTSGIACLRMAVASSGSHTVLITNNGTTGQTVTIYGIGTNPIASANLPVVVAVIPAHQNNANDALSGTYAGFVSTNVTTLAGDGLNVYSADVRTALGTNYGTYYFDALHWNNAGHALAASTILAAIPSQFIKGNVLPNVNQPLQSTIPIPPLSPFEFSSPNSSQMNSATQWNPGFKMLNANGNVYYINSQLNTGITVGIPSTIGNSVGFSVGAYTGFSSPPDLANMYLGVTGDGKIRAFPGSGNSSSTLTLQSTVVTVGPAGAFRGNNSLSSGMTNNYFTTPTAATSSVNQNSVTGYWSGQYWNGSNSTFDDLGFRNVMGSGTNPNTYLTLAHAGSTGLFGVDISPSTNTNKLGKSTFTSLPANVFQTGVGAGTDSVAVKLNTTGKIGAVKTLGVSQLDTANVQTVLNFFPKGDTRYSRITNAPIHGNSTTTGTATTAVTVSIATQVNTNYYVGIAPQDLLTAVNWYISAKTVNSFTVTFVTALTGSINFDYELIP